MNAEMEHLIELWLEGLLDGPEQENLAARLKEDPELMRLFVEANVREQQLRDVMRGELIADESRQLASTPIEPAAVETRKRFPARRAAYAIGLAACLFFFGRA